jgi:hypothetical protein
MEKFKIEEKIRYFKFYFDLPFNSAEYSQIDFGYLRINDPL